MQVTGTQPDASAGDERERGSVVGGLLACDGEDFEALATEVLRTGSALRFRATGGSMHPFIKHGDVLVARPTDGSTVRLGDVVLYRASEGRLVVHRVVGRAHNDREGSLKIRGDALRGPPCLVVPSCVLARIVAVERNGESMSLEAPQTRIVGLLHAGASLLREAVAGLLRTIRG
jgi:signal peptidase I